MAGFWDSKPPAGTGIDWRHPLAIGLSACLPLNEGDGRPRDLVSGQQTEAYAAGASGLFWAGGPNGAVLLHNSPGGANDNLAALTLPLACTPKTQAFTYWLRLYRPNIGTQSVPIRSMDPGASGGIEIRIQGDSSILLLRAQQAAFTASPANVVAIGWWDVAVTHATNNVYRYYVNGKDVGGGVTTGLFDGNKRFNLGGSGATENVEAGARTSQLLVYGRTLAPEEIAALSDDPHQIYRAPFWFALRYTTPVPVEMRARTIITPATSRGAQAAIRLSVTPRVSLLATRAAASATARLVRFRAAAIGARGEQNAIAPAVRFRAAILGVRGFLGSARVRATASTLLTSRATLTQSAAPVADAGVGGWTNELGATSNLYASLDEAVASDAEYVQSSLSPLVVDEAKIRFGPLGPPSSANDHLVRYRYQKDAAAGDNLTLVVRLYRADGVTVVAEQTHTNIEAVTDATLALTFSEANSIPIDDYSTGLVLGLRAVVA